MVCGVRSVVPSPSIPVPSDCAVSTTFPERTPSAVASTPIVRLLLSMAPGVRPMNEPLPVAAPVAPPRLASRYSVNPSLMPVLLTARF